MKLDARKILLCVSGGIAAFKAIDLASQLSKTGAEIKTIMTDGALEFVSPLNCSAITQGSVHSSLFHDADPIPHISLADWAELIVVAPATANVMAKAAHGISDDLLSATLLAHTKPILFAPAMNVHMYENPATQANLQILKDRGHLILAPDSGRLACGYTGQGKFPPVEEVLAAIKLYLDYKQDLKGIKVLLTAGACIEEIDPMRCITNRSSGKMGMALARALYLRGAELTLIHGHLETIIPYYIKKVIKAESAAEMDSAINKESAAQEWIIMCAAVSDYKPQSKATDKIKKGKDLCLNLIQTTDILAGLGKKKALGQILIGFAAETQDLETNARIKLEKKNLDLIAVNHLRVAGQDATTIQIITPKSSTNLEGDKFTVALGLIDAIKNLPKSKN